MAQKKRVEDGRLVPDRQAPAQSPGKEILLDHSDEVPGYGRTPPGIRRRGVAEIVRHLDHPEYRQWAQDVTAAHDGLLRDDPAEGSTVEQIQRRVANWVREAEQGPLHTDPRFFLEVFNALDQVRSERSQMRESLRHAIDELAHMRELAIRTRDTMVQPQFPIREEARAEVSDTFRIR